VSSFQSSFRSFNFPFIRRRRAINHRSTLIASIALACLCLGIYAACLIRPALAAPALQTSIPHVILIDADTGSVLFEKGADDLVSPASTSKIMTAELVFEALAAGKIKLTD